MRFDQRSLFALLRQIRRKTGHAQLRNAESSYVGDPGLHRELEASYNETVPRTAHAPFFRMSWHQRLGIPAAESVVRGKRKSALDARLLGKHRVAPYPSNAG